MMTRTFIVCLLAMSALAAAAPSAQGAKEAPAEENHLFINEQNVYYLVNFKLGTFETAKGGNSTLERSRLTFTGAVDMEGWADFSSARVPFGDYIFTVMDVKNELVARFHLRIDMQFAENVSALGGHIELRDYFDADFDREYPLEPKDVSDCDGCGFPSSFTTLIIGSVFALPLFLMALIFYIRSKHTKKSDAPPASDAEPPRDADGAEPGEDADTPGDGELGAEADEDAEVALDDGDGTEEEDADAPDAIREDAPPAESSEPWDGAGGEGADAGEEANLPDGEDKAGEADDAGGAEPGGQEAAGPDGGRSGAGTERARRSSRGKNA